MLAIHLLEHLYWTMHHFLHPQGYRAICHTHRLRFINPKPGSKWVNVAIMKCKIQAPSAWYRSP